MDKSSGVWVYLTFNNGNLSKNSLEVISAGKKVADKLNQKLIGILIGDSLKNKASIPLEYGVDEVIYCEDPKLNEYLCLPYTSVFEDLIKKKKPNSLIFVADEIGRDLAPRLAYRVYTGLATDNIDLEIEDFYHAPTKITYKDLLIQIRPDFATRVAKIYTPKHRPQIATIRSGNFPLPEKNNSNKGKVTKFKVKLNDDDFKMIITDVKSVASDKIDFDNAKVIISLGLGILKDKLGNSKNPHEAYKLVEELAHLIREKLGLKTEIGSSRALIYAEIKELEGLITRERQIGQTGKTVSPDIYIAIGISGSVQHKVGMLKSKRIISINTDLNAPMNELAHYPIIGDLYEEVPRMIDELKRL